MTGRRWGKAGIRLTDGQIDAQDRRVAAEIAVSRQGRARDLQIARKKWAAGMVVPNHITCALDMCELYGPEVDEKCLAKEPDVDMWEAGVLYPSWEQIVALSRLTGLWPTWLMGPPREPLRFEDTSMRFHMSAPQSPAPVYAFTASALADAAALGVRA